MDDVGDGLHLYALGLVNVFKRVEIAGLLMLNHADLEKKAVTGKERTRARAKHALPKAPLPTHLKRTKWKRLTSPSKSMT